MTVRQKQDTIDGYAAEWVIRLGGAPLTEAEQQAFDQWLAQDPAHVAAYLRADAVWGESAVLTSLSLPLRATAKRPRRAAGPILAGLALAFVIGGAGRFWLGDPLTMLMADHRTGPGEIRTVTLTDGSQVQLDTESAIVVDFTPHERRVRLLSGDAYFTVAPVAGSERRPFVVAASDGTAQALGTQFMVAKEADGGLVTVAEHKVRVSAAIAGGATGEVTLSPGQAVRYDDLHGLESVETVDLAQASSWREGRLVFNNQPLSEVITVLNRYRRGRIVIANRRLATLKVSGVFMTSDLSGALVAIRQELGAKTAAMPPFVTLLY